MMESVSSGNNLNSFETTRQTKTGELINVSANFSQIYNDQGIFDSISVVIRDTTLRKELEDKSKKLAILEAKRKEMEGYTYIASHDLRHPLLTILGYIKIFREDYEYKVDENGKMFLKTITDSANRMDDLIKNLLDYSRLSQIKEM